MKNRYLIACLFLVILGISIAPKDNANAYLTDQCFAIEYKWTSGGSTVDSEGNEKANTEVRSTNKICLNTKDNKKLRVSPNIPDNANSVLTLPYLKVVDGGDAVELTYCENGSNVTIAGTCRGYAEGQTAIDVKNGDAKAVKKLSQVFKFSDSNYNIKQLAEEVYSTVSSLSGTNDIFYGKYEILGLNDNTTKGQEDEVIDEDANKAKARCKGSGGAFGLEWVVCSVVTWMSEAADTVYNEYVEPSLQIEPQLFTGGNESVRSAWGVFQNFANILFVILLLFVIFSQLTGVGIDNYGIKRILPKLILAAILINLSYLVCLLIVDVSNILGNSFYSLFKGLAEGISINNEMMIESDTINLTDTTGGLAGVGLLAAIVGGGAALFANPAILLSLLIAALGIMISIFFLFILLSAREAAIIVLVVVSPIAVIAYVLPNTKKISDKWWSLFEGLLLVYPICGLLVGAGDYISRLLLSSGMGKEGFIAAFTAMIVSVVPIFFIPTVLKNSFAALGNLGAKISGLGQKVSSGATGLARGSQAYKNAQELGLERRTRLQAGIGKDGKAIGVGGLGTMLRGGKRSMARARAQYLRNQDARDRENSLMGVGYDAALIGQAKRAEGEELANYMTLINDKTRNGEDEAALFNIFDQYMSVGNKAGAVAAARIAGRRKDTAARFAGTKLTGTKDDGNGNKVPATSGYDSGMLQSVAKEMATGDNSGNYRAAAPLGFEFASQINKAGRDVNGNLQMDTDYGNWVNQGTNVKDALDHHVTNSQELVGMKDSSLNEIANMMQQGKLDDATAARMQKLAAETIANRGQTGVWDTTKEANINRIANGG